MSTTFQPNLVVSATSILTTELNALANGSSCNASAAIDNTAELCFWMDLELVVTFGTNPTVNDPVEVYLLPSIDGTNYADGSSSVSPAPNLFVGAFIVQATSGSAQRLLLTGIPIPPLKFKLMVKNASGFAFPATGTVIRYTLSNEIGV